MLNSDLVFNVLTAAAAFGAAVVLAPSAARTDAPAQLYARSSAEPSALHNRAAMFAESEQFENVRKTSTAHGDARLEASSRPTPVRTDLEVRRP
jgi:hypothetical protein